MARGRQRIVVFIGAGAEPHAAAAQKAFEAAARRMGLSWEAQTRAWPVAPAELASADRVVTLFGAGAEAADVLPGRSDVVERWAVGAGPAGVAGIEREVMNFIARLLGGGGQPAESAPAREAAPARPAKAAPKPVVRIGRETKGRRGKGVTLVSGLPMNEAGVRDLAARLKQACGTGGTVKDGQIEIQGDQRDRLTAELERLGYAVKRVGG